MNMKRISLRRILFAVVAVIALAVVPAAVSAPTSTAPRWETVSSVIPTLSDETFDVAIRDNYIYVYTPTPVNVKLFTILGQLVSQGNLPAGTSRFKVNARGIYILKAGTITRRVTI